MKKRMSWVRHDQGPKVWYKCRGYSYLEFTPTTSYIEYVEIPALTEQDKIKLKRAKRILEERESFIQKIKNLWLKLTL